MRKRLLSGAVAIIVIALFLVIWKPPLPEINRPAASSFDPVQVQRGRVLAGIGNCMACHTASPQRPYAGGVAFDTPFGTLYATNITPHPSQGIGRWSRDAFVRAMREGVSRDGSHLFPAFPYTHFTRVTEADLDALYAYFMTREPVDYRAPENALEFPYDQRFLLAGWKMLFFDYGSGQSDPQRSGQWNRGAYLAEGLGHCTACHSPRNEFGAEVAEAAYDGAVVDNWYAPALNASQTVPVPWDEDSLYAYLRQGQSDYHGVAVGSMSEVVHQGLAQAPDADIRALAVYLKDLGGAPPAGKAAAIAASTIERVQGFSEGGRSRGEAIYVAACAACHYNTPDQPSALRPELSLNSAITAPDPINLLRVTLEGIGIHEGTPGLVMPGFADALTDDDLISLANFLRRRQGSEPAWDNLEARLNSLRH